MRSLLMHQIKSRRGFGQDEKPYQQGLLGSSLLYGVYTLGRGFLHSCFCTPIIGEMIQSGEDMHTFELIRSISR